MSVVKVADERLDDRLDERLDERLDDRSQARSIAFDDWLTRLQPDLRRLALWLAASSTDAADLAQATSLRALEKQTLFVHGSINELRRWLTRVMFNLHYERQRGATREVLADWLDELAATNDTGPPVWLTVGDEEVTAAVEQLNPTLRVAYVLYAVDRCSYATISARLQIPVRTVATKVYRARARLREALTAGREENPPIGPRSLPARSLG
jgi:RNA polymerase sigma-70 factor (ECF subfamily)